MTMFNTETLKSIFIKFSSLSIMIFILLYILLSSGLESVGYFSAVTAITAPIAMFCQFRYIEVIGLAAEDKKEWTFFTSIISSLCVFLVISLGIVIFLRFINYQNYYLLILALAYKFFEMFSDSYIAYLSSVKKNKRAFSVVVMRVFLVLVCTAFSWVWKHGDIVENILWAMLVAYLISSIFDFILIYKNANIHVQFIEIWHYICANIGYGFLAVFVSINSLIPRYFFMYAGDYKNLGLFSVLYLCASFPVNVFQFAVSLRATLIKEYLVKNFKIQKLNIILSLFVIISLLFLFKYVVSTSYLYLLLYIVLMFLALMIRGIFITYSISNQLNTYINFVVVASMVACSGCMLLLFMVNWFSSLLIFGVFYVFLASSLTTFMLIFRNRRVNGC